MSTKLTREQLFDYFIELLEITTPYKYEQRIRNLLPSNQYVDNVGNVWIKVGDGPETKENLFCCHMDTVGQSPERTEPFYYDGKLYALSKTSSCLGGDDRCGVLCLVAMINAEIPGWYLFHVGEEKGAVGAEFASVSFDFTQYKRAIEFDRRGTASIITVMMGNSRTCSDVFANALAKQLNDAAPGLEYKPDDTGAYTDVFAYQDRVPECTNISVGYALEHTNSESIQVDWLLDKLIPALYEVKWNELPVVRDPKADNSVHQECWTGWRGRHSKTTTNSNIRSEYNNHKSRKDSNKHNSKLFDDHISYYNSEHGFNDNDQDAEINSLEGLSVFDMNQMFDSCNFCGEKSEKVGDYWLDGKFWSLCDECKDYLQINDALKSQIEKTSSKEKEKEIEEEEDALKKAAEFAQKEEIAVESAFEPSTDESDKKTVPDSIVEVEQIDLDDNWGLNEYQ